MTITRKQTAEKIVDYLCYRISRAELANWAQTAMMEADFEEKDYRTLKEVTRHLTLADVNKFGITWEQCYSYLSSLGYRIDLKITDRGEV